MPSSPDTISNLPFMLTLPHSDNISNDLMTWDYREGIPKRTVLDPRVGVANS
jgi:hypothetical protein